MAGIKTQKSERGTMLDILFVLAVLTFMSFYYYGLRAVIVVAISITASVVTDVICLYLRKAESRRPDLSAVVSGAVLALMMPASISYGILIITNIIAITIGKQIFGGKGKAIFSPVAVGYVFAAFCWKDVILMYPRPSEALSLASQVTNTLSPSFSKLLDIATVPSISDIDIMLGKFTGPMGSAHILILAVCAIVLMFRKSISALTFSAGVGTVLLIGYIFPVFGDSRGASVTYELIGNMMLFGMIFLACDYHTRPITRSSRFIYGVLIGIFTSIFRHLGTVENAVVFAVIVANPLRISLDKSSISFTRMVKNWTMKNESLRSAIRGEDNNIKIEITAGELVKKASETEKSDQPITTEEGKQHDEKS